MFSIDRVCSFRCLCTGEKGQGKSGKPLHFKNSAFHRVIPGFMLRELFFVWNWFQVADEVITCHVCV
jgi:hypothetical protein